MASRHLFIRPAAFGDVLLTTPFLRQLQARPGTTVDLYSLHGHAWPPGSGRVLSMRTLALDRALAGGYDQVHLFSYEHHPALHALDGYALTSGLEYGDGRLDWTVLPEEAAWAARLLEAAPRPWIGFHPASGTPLRSLPPDLAAAAARSLRRRFGGTLVVTGEARSGWPEVMDLGGRVPSLRHLAALVARLDGLVTIDSGPFHLAQALGVPTAAVFGSTLPELRATRPDRLQVLLAEGLDCLGCHHRLPPGAEALAACARGDLACLRPDPEALAAALARALAGEPDPRLAARVDRYREARAGLLAAGLEREAALAAVRERLVRLDRHLGGFKRLRRRLRAWFST